MAVDAEILKIAVLGAGRMGRELMRCIAGDARFRLAGLWTRKKLAEEQEIIVSDSLETVLSAADVAIDFSLPAATPNVLDAVLATGKPLVIGVSGLDDAMLKRIGETSHSVPVVYDRNMSLGIAVLDALLRQAAVSLGPGFEAEIHETHHVHKLDAPSGTALQMGEALAESRGQDFQAVMKYDPDGLRRPLAAGDIAFEVTREGDVPGEHTVVFHSDSERLELKHSVASRRVFADGALRAALWLRTQPPGLYAMRDILFER